MDDRPRQVPQERPGLRTRQQGNFISVRQKPDQDAGWGTLLNPKRFELPLLTPHQIKSHLGYEAVPSSEFWQFSLSGRVRLQVNRLSADRYANSVGVALLDQENRRVAPLVQSASGRGEPVEIGPGTYKVVASLGIAENIKDLVFEFLATPTGGSLRGAASASVRGTARPLAAGQHQLQGAGLLLTSAAGMIRASQLNGEATALAGGFGGLLPPERALSAVAHATAAGTGQLRAEAVAPLQGICGQDRPVSAGRLCAVRWLKDPDGNWRARAAGGAVELNRSYVHFAADLMAQRQLLEHLSAALNYR